MLVCKYWPATLTCSVAVNVQQAVQTGVLGEGDLRKVDGAEGRAVVAVLDQLAGDFEADALLRFFGGTADVGREQHVIELAQRREELFGRALRLFWEYIDRGAAQVAAPQRSGKGFDIDHRAARGVDEMGAGPYARQLGGADHAGGLRRFRNVQRYHVGGLQQGVERRHGPCVAHGELGFNVEKDHLHAERFGQHAQL